MNQTAELERYLDIATEAAAAAGAIVLANWGQVNQIQEKGRPGDLVTEIDRKAETEILKIIQRHFPNHAILAEESGTIRSTDNHYLWAIDPLDGTTNYAHAYPAATVSVGLLIDNIPVVGAIYNPFRNELFRAARGCGATLNRCPIRVSAIEKLSQSLLVSGFAYDRRETPDNNYAEFCYLTHLTQGVRRSGSAALDLADVACGRLDGYWERGIRPWDIVAGTVIVQEAGGTVTAYDGSPLDLASGRILATNGQLQASLSQALAEATQWHLKFE
jgi:myo-inositol-1(or 4)-monophosphatase